MRTNKGQRRVHEFAGEKVGRALCALLNAPYAEERLEPVLQFLEICKKHHEAKDLREKLGLQDKANLIVQRFQFSLIVEAMNGVLKTKYVPASPDVAALQLFLELGGEGLHWNLKRCEKADCRKFFLARFSHQRFHADQCRVAVLQSDPDRQEGRKQYMRKLRLQNKLRFKKGGK